MELSPVEKLDVILKRENISYSDLAGRLGSSRQAVSNFFRAENITLKTLENLAAAAGYKMTVEFEKITPDNEKM